MNYRKAGLMALFVLALSSCKKKNSEPDTNGSDACVINKVVLKTGSGSSDGYEFQYAYDGMGRVSSRRATYLSSTEQFTSTFTYETGLIKETATSNTSSTQQLYEYRYDAQNRIVSKTVLGLGTGEEDVTTFVYNADGYLSQALRRKADRNTGVRNEVFNYRYTNGNLTSILNELSFGPGEEPARRETVLTYDNADQPANYQFDLYPDLYENYGVLKAYFGKRSKNRIASVTEDLGYKIATYRYTYQTDDRNNITQTAFSEEGSGNQVFADYSLTCR